MALTAEQQAQVDVQVAIQNAQSAAQIAAENARHANQMALQAKQAKLESLRIAQQTLVENSRNKPVDERDITAADITAYANTLVAYVNS